MALLAESPGGLRLPAERALASDPLGQPLLASTCALTSLDSGAPTIPISAFVATETRFAVLERTHAEPRMLVRYRREAWASVVDDYARAGLQGTLEPTGGLELVVEELSPT